MHRSPDPPGSPGESDAARLVRECIAGDDRARARLWTEYNALVRSAVTRRLTQLTGAPPPPEDVEDLTHDLFVLLMQDDCRALRTLRDPDALVTWLVVMARNRAADHLRRAIRHERGRETLLREEPEPYTPSPEAGVVRSERHENVESQVQRLKDEERLILELYYQQELKYAEIAQVLGLNVNTVATRLRRAKARLLELMEDGDDAG
jgi:RNA polymerase sigma-70 factor (ECF subfamily)